MQTSHETKNGSKLPKPTLLHRLIRSLPILALLLLAGVIVVLAGKIQSEGEVIQTQKTASLRLDRPKTNVIAMEMAPERLQEKISLPGYAKPWVALTVVAEVAGKIVEKNVSEGSRVAKGDVLARIDDRDYRNAYASAKASYEVAKANEKRLKTLFKDRVATQAQIDDIIASVQTSKAAMNNAALALERCTIRSPMAGVVNRIQVEPGQYMDVGKPVVQILEIDRLKIEVGIPESDVDAVRKLKKFAVTIDALGGKVFSGTRHYLYKNSDSFARLYNLEIAVQNPGHEILPDMFTRVDIVKTEVPDGLAVPLYAVVKKGQSDAVYVVENDVVRLQPVSLGIQDGWRMEVKSGLNSGEEVVVVGQRSIKDGETVRVTRVVRSLEELAQ